MNVNREKLSQAYQTNTWLINKHAEGVTHTASLAQLPIRSNTFNWVLGHIVQARSGLLQMLGEDGLVSEAVQTVYGTNAPELDGATAVPLPELLALLHQSTERITAAITNASDHTLNSLFDAERGTTIADRIAGLNWHETYHIGQLEILRQAAGELPAFP
ncbi:MAG: DinB family protein [Ardenticatenaceae bacterium]|nr:DinB family protein [Ardenticatenaceae bacterium]